MSETVPIVTHMATLAADRPEVLWLQARLAQARHKPKEMADRLTRLLKVPQLGDQQRAEALLLLGIAYDALGQSVESFAAARRGKEIQRILYAAQAESRESEIAKLRRLGEWIGTEPGAWSLPAASTPAGAAATHVFLVGFPRSGTTLLEQVLAAHPNVRALEEAPTLATAYQAFLSDADACKELMHLSKDEAAAWSDYYWEKARQHGVEIEGRLFVDKQPAGTLYLPIIARLFPQAKILFAIRDPRDVVLSCFRQAFQINAMTYTFTDLAETAACYTACMALSERARVRLPLAWLDVRHEALVEDFDAELGRILSFLELDLHPAMRDFARVAEKRAIRTPSATQVRAGLNRRGLGRWELYREQLAPVLPVLAPWVEHFGYAA